MWILINSVAILMLLRLTAGNTCASDWTVSGDQCYRVEATATPATYADAKTACAALGTGGLLASPKTQVVKELLDTLNTGGIEFWVGLDDITAEGTYKFSDGTSLAISGGTLDGGDATWATYSAWKSGQPATAANTRENQDCVRTKTAEWDDVACAQTKQYACQKSATAPTTPTTPTTPSTQTPAMDEMATGACAGMPGNGDALLVAAVRIDCSSDLDCSKVCKDAPTAHVAGPTTDMTGMNPWKCFNSLYVYPNMPQLGAYTAVGTDAGKFGHAIWRYNSCTKPSATATPSKTACGPNYCCCYTCGQNDNC